MGIQVPGINTAPVLHSFSHLGGLAAGRGAHIKYHLPRLRRKHPGRNHGGQGLHIGQACLSQWPEIMGAFRDDKGIVLPESRFCFYFFSARRDRNSSLLFSGY